MRWSEPKHDTRKSLQLRQQITLDLYGAGVQIGAGTAEQIRVRIRKRAMGPRFQPDSEAGQRPDLQADSDRTGKKDVAFGICLDPCSADRCSKVGTNRVAPALVGSSDLQSLQFEVDERLNAGA